MPAPTKTKSPARPARGTLIEGEAKVNVAFGITFNLRGQQIPVTAADIGKAKEEGIKLALPAPVELGSFEDFETWFAKQFGVTFPKAAELPEPLGKIFGKLAKLVVTVTEAKVRVPGTLEPEAHTEYTLMLSAEWPKSEGGIPLIENVLTIEGAMFGVSNETKKPA